MSYLLIRQIEKLPFLGIKKSERVLNDPEEYKSMNDEQIDHVESITDTYRELYQGTGLEPTERDKTILAKHNIVVKREQQNKPRPKFVLSTPFGKITF